jgi:monooxygenase
MIRVIGHSNHYPFLMQPSMTAPGKPPVATAAPDSSATEAIDPAYCFDVLIVGAGLSGICAAYHLQKQFPNKRIAILEGRDAIGGTWDLFRYPGVRSDSDMFTLGYSFRKWGSEKSLADGASILDYIRTTARECDIDKMIRFRHRVREAAWSSLDACWRLAVTTGDAQQVRMRCNFLFMCSGYYDYEKGYLPSWTGMADYGGTLIHPQQWPADLDYRDRRVVVIGSGATAVTLVPAMAQSAAHVTMLQRSPTYIVARPASDGIARWLQRYLPGSLAHKTVRWKNILLSTYFFNLARRKPEFASRAIVKGVAMHLGPDYDVARHFTPTYKPWDQRLCLIPDADLFKAIRAGKASVATDEIETFTLTGLQLRSGAHLEADIIVAATGLKVQLFGGMKILIDGKERDVAEALSYKGMMFSDVPNLAAAFGYTNASWTLKSELTTQYVCRLLRYMDAHGYAACVPARGSEGASATSSLPLSSGYVQRALAVLPKQGADHPWKTYQNYFKDIWAIRMAAIDDGVMRFDRRAAAPVAS